MRVLTTIGRYSLAGGLLAVALQSAYADEGMNYTWVEGGVSRVAPKINSKSVHIDGGYLRGSFAIGDNFYVLGGYSQNDNDGKWKKTEDREIGPYTPIPYPGWSDTDNFTETRKGKEKFSQAELGFGFHIALPGLNRVDATGELIGVHTRQESQLTTMRGDIETTVCHPRFGCGTIVNSSTRYSRGLTKSSSTDHVWGGKALVGLRMQPFSFMELWTKAGYSHMGKRINDSVLGNLGVQFRITNNFGLVGEADIFDKQANQYRIGARLSF